MEALKAVILENNVFEPTRGDVEISVYDRQQTSMQRYLQLLLKSYLVI